MNSTQVVELLARREGFEYALNGPTNEHVWWAGDHIVNLPHYLTSIDALQPVLATLTKEEWNSLRNTLYDADVLNWNEYLTIKPELLALCIAKAIEKKGEES